MSWILVIIAVFLVVFQYILQYYFKDKELEKKNWSRRSYFNCFCYFGQLLGTAERKY